MHAKSSETRRMFQWNAVDTSRDLGGQNVPPPKKNFRIGYLTKQADDTNGITDSFLSLAKKVSLLTFCNNNRKSAPI